MGQRDSSVGRVLAFQVFELGWFPSNPYDPLSPDRSKGIIPEYLPTTLTSFCKGGNAKLFSNSILEITIIANGNIRGLWGI